jgi:hypothetical protein
MLTLMGWLVQIENSRISLTASGRERQAQLAYSEQKVGKTGKKAAAKPAAQAVSASSRCCPAVAA